jgi:hypothetical protein
VACATADTRGDPAARLTQGLACFLIALCLEYNDNSTSMTRDALLEMITNRIGLEDFLEKVALLLKTDSLQAALRPLDVRRLAWSGARV